MGRLILNEIEYSGTDGGVELTYAEYLALPEPAKHNGTTYYITDVNDDENGFQPVVYSEDEREIGVWTDGKPLYEKTVNIGKITSTGEKTYTLGMQNVDTIVAYTILPLERSGDTGLYAVDNYNYSWGGGSYTAYTIKKDTTNGLQIIIYSGYYTSSNDIYVTVRYTKTTDTPGSGTWTPQGVPAVHYSTDERVVGTWIDGRTIYEKSIEISDIHLGNGGSYVIDTITNLDCIIECNGTFAEGSYKYTLNDLSLRIRQNGTDVQLHAGASWDITTGVVVIQYIKTL